MKRLLNLTLAALLVVAVTSCNNVLDKKISKDSFLQDIQEIQKKDGDKYSSKDFAALAIGVSLGNVPGISNLNGTYRQALDTLKSSREKAEADSIRIAQKYQKDLKEYNDKVTALTKAINVTVLSKGSQPVNDFDQEFVFVYSLANGASQSITSFEGKIVSTDESGNLITPITISYNNPIDAGKTIQYRDTYDYNGLDVDQTTLMNTPLGKLRFNWEPLKVVFKDGTTITAPTEPEKPSA